MVSANVASIGWAGHTIRDSPISHAPVPTTVANMVAFATNCIRSQDIPNKTPLSYLATDHWQSRRKGEIWQNAYFDRFGAVYDMAVSSEPRPVAIPSRAHRLLSIRTWE